jgi:hypothetical protein
MPKITVVNHGPEDVEVSWDQMEDVPAAPAKPELKQDGKVIQQATPSTPGGRKAVTHASVITSAQQRTFDTAITGAMKVRVAPKAAK